MITLQKSGDSAVKFVFEDSQHYLYGNGEIEVPVNSLILVEDSSDMATFKKIDGDVFVSALYSEFGMTKAELETFYKENMVGGGGIDSGAVESIVEDYMTDPNYVADSAMTGQVYVGVSGHTKWSVHNDLLQLWNDSLGAQGYIVPSSEDGGSYGTNDNYLYISGVPTITNDFKEYLAVSGKTVSHLQPSNTNIALVIKQEYASAITQTYKDYDIWYGFDEMPTKPTFLSDISGATYGTDYEGQRTSFANVSEKRYLVLNPLSNRETRRLGSTSPLDLSGLDMMDDMNRIYLSCNGIMESYPHTVIGGYVIVGQADYISFQKTFIMPLSNGSVGLWNQGDQFTSAWKRFSYNLQMDKQYDGDNMTDLYNKVSSAQTTANSAQTTANQALSQANINRDNIIQVDWNQNDSGSTRYDYIKNRPMWKEKVFDDSGKIYESDPIMSFQLNNYEVNLDSPLAVGDEVRVKSNSRYGQQTMFTDSIKVNSGNVPSGSYYCGTYDPMSTWSSKYMWSNDLQTWYVYNQMFDYEASLVIIKAVDVYHKLDSQYIGDDIARTSDIPTVPTSNSAFTNDAGYITSDALSGYAESSAVTAEINSAVSGFVQTSAVTTNVTSASTDSQIPTAKAVFDAIPQGGGGATYSAGTNIDITNDTISCTLPINAGTKSGITIGDSETQSTGIYAVGIGHNSDANGYYSMSIGSNTSNNANCSLNIGDGGGINNSDGGVTCCLRIGYGDWHVNKSFQIQCGRTLHPKNDYEVGFGLFNVTSSGSTTFGHSGNTMFSIGNGYDFSSTHNWHNAFEIRQNGDVYIPNTDDTSVTGNYAYSLYPMVRLQDTVTQTAANTTALGGLSLVKLTQSEYDALTTKDSNTLYVIIN